MEEKDSIKDLFQEKLSQLETPVRPELWSAVSSSIASTSAAATSSGLSLLAKLTIGFTIAASVTGTVIFLSKEEVKETPKIEIQKANKQKEAKTTENKLENNTAVSKLNNSNTEKRVSENNAVETTNQFESILENSNSVNMQLVEGPISYSQIETREEIKAPKNNPKIESTAKTHNQESKQNVATEKLPEESKLQFKLPNIFTPNGDGNNDVLKLSVENVTEFVIVVLDSKSNVVFKSEDVNFNWDGTNLNGDKLPAGNYIYYVTAKDLEGKAVTKYSALTIKY